MAGNIGMMNEAYFLPKNVLLDWVNNFLQLNLEKVEHMATGACYCNLFDALHPRTIPMNKVDFSVKYEYDYAKNWKLLQNAFLKVGIKKQIPVERLTKARYQDNLEFLQWFYKYAHDTYPGDCDNPDYDAIGQRYRAKGGKEFSGNAKTSAASLASKQNRGGSHRSRTHGKENMGVSNRPPSSSSARGNYNNSNKNGNSNNNNGINNGINNNNNNNHGSSASVGSINGENNNDRRQRRGHFNSNHGRNNSITSSNNVNGSENMSQHLSNNDYMLEELREENRNLMLNNEKYRKQIETLENDQTQLRNVARDIEKERDFYFNKVLQVENICKQHDDQSLPLLKKIYETLYQNEESTEAAQNDGNNNNSNNNSSNAAPIDDGNNHGQAMMQDEMMDNNMIDNNFNNKMEAISTEMDSNMQNNIMSI